MNILSIIATVLKIVWRWITNADNPQNKYDKAKQENAQIIATGDADALNKQLDADCGQLPKHTGSYPIGLDGD